MYHYTMDLSPSEKTKQLFIRVYLWMAAALCLTGLTAYLVFLQKTVLFLLRDHWWFGLIVFLGQLTVVLALVRSLYKLSFKKALTFFTLYSILSGVTLSLIFVTYELGSIVQTLFLNAGMFFSMALYGFFTKTDLSRLNSIIRMGLWGIILALFINIFTKSILFDLILSICGVVLFCTITAYDVHMIKTVSEQYTHIDKNNLNKLALFGAFQLQLDFINLFLNLLALTGKRKK